MVLAPKGRHALWPLLFRMAQPLLLGDGMTHSDDFRRVMERLFDLEVVQEPARGMWFVQDNENPEAGVMFGPVHHRGIADAWVQGFNEAIGTIGRIKER